MTPEPDVVQLGDYCAMCGMDGIECNEYRIDLPTVKCARCGITVGIVSIHSENVVDDIDNLEK